jgi:ribosome maturation factor rimM
LEKLIKNTGNYEEYKVSIYSDDIYSIEEYNDIYIKEKNMYIKINLEITGSLKNRIIADIYFENPIYDDIILQGKEIYIQKKDLKKLEDGEYYILDLLECNVYEDNKLIGKVTDVLNNNITETLEVDRKRDNRKKIINPYNR